MSICSGVQDSEGHQDYPEWSTLWNKSVLGRSLFPSSYFLHKGEIPFLPRMGLYTSRCLLSLLPWEE